MLQTTITAWALPCDLFIFFAWYQSALNWSADHRRYLCIALLCWTFIFSKTVKLWGHFFRYPVDVLFVPVYIAFGYFHGLIKLWGLFTLSEVYQPLLSPTISMLTARPDYLGQQRRRGRRRSRAHDPAPAIRLSRRGRPQVRNIRIPLRDSSTTARLRKSYLSTAGTTAYHDISRLTTLLRFSSQDTHTLRLRFRHTARTAHNRRRRDGIIRHTTRSAQKVRWFLPKKRFDSVPSSGLRGVYTGENKSASL